MTSHNLEITATDIETGKPVTIEREYLDLTGQDLYTFTVDGEQVLKTKKNLLEALRDGYMLTFNDTDRNAHFVDTRDKQSSIFKGEQKLFSIKTEQLKRIYLA